MTGFGILGPATGWNPNFSQPTSPSQGELGGTTHPTRAATMPTIAREESVMPDSIDSRAALRDPDPPTARPWRAVVFDFDGTLADSYPRVVGLLPRLAREFRFKAPQPDEIRELRELSSPQILSRLGISWWKVPILLWRARSMMRSDASPIPLFPGIPRLLRSLDASEVEWGILTSNHHAVVRRSLELGGAPEPGWLESSSGLSNKAQRLKQMARALDCAPHEMVMVADETRDIEAAREAGIAMIGVDWGYSTPESLVRNGVQQLAKSRDELSRMLGITIDTEAD